MKVHIILDYRGKFYSSTRHWDASLRVDRLVENFKSFGVEVTVHDFYEVSRNLTQFKDQFVLYQSSEDREGYYKSYIEDIILALHLAGAILIPPYHMLRAHHNKCFMELYRDVVENSDIINNLDTHCFGTFEDYQKNIDHFKGSKWVLKPASGALSKGVQLLSNQTDFKTVPKRISLSFQLKEYFKILVKHLLKSRYQSYERKSYHRRKFILQEFVPDLKGDYKVLVYGDKYYMLSRQNRKNDFRASGSGKMKSQTEVNKDLLNYCMDVFDKFNVPFISIDVAMKGNEFYLIEFQFLMFGNYTIEKSDSYFVCNSGSWEVVQGESNLETEFVRSVVRYIDKNHNHSFC